MSICITDKSTYRHTFISNKLIYSIVQNRLGKTKLGSVNLYWQCKKKYHVLHHEDPHTPFQYHHFGLNTYCRATICPFSPLTHPPFRPKNFCVGRFLNLWNCQDVYLLLLKASAILMVLHAKKNSYFLRNMWLYYTTIIQVKTKHVWVQQLTFGSSMHQFWTTLTQWQTCFTSLTQNFISMKFKKVLAEN